MEEKKNYSVKIISDIPLTTEQFNQIAQTLSKILPEETITPSEMLDDNNALKYKLTKQQAEDLNNELWKANIWILIIEPEIEKKEAETKEDKSENICSNCKNPSLPNDTFYRQCGTKLIHTKGKSSPKEVILMGNDKKNPDDFLRLISFLLPIIGFILGVIFVTKESEVDKNTGKSCLLWALGGVIAGTILWIIFLGALVNYPAPP